MQPSYKILRALKLVPRVVAQRVIEESAHTHGDNCDAHKHHNRPGSTSSSQVVIQEESQPEIFNDEFECHLPHCQEIAYYLYSFKKDLKSSIKTRQRL